MKRTENKQRFTAYTYYILALLLFGSNGIVASHISMPSEEIVLYRTLIGSAFLLLVFVEKKEKWTFCRNKKQFGFLLLSSAAMGLSWMFLYEAYVLVGVSIASLLYYCGPVIVMALSPLVFKERLTAGKGVGFLIVLMGIFLINGNSVGDAINRTGFFCGIMAAAMYSAMVIFNKKASEIGGMENSLLQLAFSCMTVAAVMLIKGDFYPGLPADSVLPLLFLGVVNTGVGCYLYFSRLDQLPVQNVSVLGYLEPLSALFFSAFFLGEKLSGLQIVGAALVIGGAIYGTSKNFCY